LDAKDFTIGDRTFHVRNGYELELVAGPDLVERPIAVSFDEQGRLYVTDSAGMSDRATDQILTKPHRMRRLTDTNSDGIYDESTLFAEHLMFPEGCLYYEGSVYVAAPPEIWKLTDTDGDGLADERSVWFDGTTLTGCGNDLHGPYLGPDGWFYWCKGAFAEQNWMVNEKPFRTRSSHIFRSLPDGSRMEPVLTGGMDNPVNVAFLQDGERFLSCTFFQHPANGQRDGLIHSVYGAVYGKKHDSIYEHPMTGEVMPVMTHMGAAAPCGLLAIDHGQTVFGRKSTSRQLFGCYFNLHKVVWHELVSDGSTFTSQDADLVSCDHPDFHPTDVQLAPDGSLLIVDTGGWYKVCCPTSQLAKPDVLGAIYRLRKTGQEPMTDPLGTQLAWDTLDADELTELLNDDRPFVQDRAVRTLRRKGDQALPALSRALRNQQPDIRKRAIFVLAGIDHPEAREMIRPLVHSQNDTEQRAALYSISLWRDSQSIDAVLEFIHHSNHRTARLAANAAGRIGDPRAVPELIQALGERNFLKTEFDETGSPISPGVRVREHAFVYGLIETNNPAATRSGLTSTDPRILRGTLVALDQMPSGSLDAETLLPFLRHEDVAVARTAAWVVGHHAEWGPQLVRHYQEELNQVPLMNPEQLSDQLARLASSPAIQELLANAMRDPSDVKRLTAFRAVSRSGLSSLPAAWLEAAGTTLTSMSVDTTAAAIEQVRQWPLPKGGHPQLNAALNHIGRLSTVEASVRLDALATAGAIDSIDETLYQWLRDALVSDPELGLRSSAARVFSRSSLTEQQQNQLVSAIHVIGPFELPVLLAAFTAPSEQLGLRVVAAVPQSPGMRGLRVDQLKAWLEKYPAAVTAAAQPLIRELNPSVEQQTRLLESLLANLPPGDVRRGHEIFNSPRVKCISCHTRGYHGGRLGPDLTRIGKVRNTRDLVEAIVFPSASLVRGYEPVNVLMNDGQVLSGIIAGENQQEIVLAVDADQRRHLNRTDIDEIVPASVSVMPAGLEKILTPQEISDLVAFLQQD
ncbi:MAG: HEAT repeat domain-containing protein, partial [Planctomycetaceae bacterium]|nr:HEAT repeat domain-containing protein [Planctomycetaceae bacterium]